MTALIKNAIHNSIAEALYNEVTSRTAQYYYFMGRPKPWTDELNPPSPIDSFAYELETRNDIVTAKSIAPGDVSLVIPRKNWTSGEIYDIYDDQYSEQVISIDLIDGGVGYSTTPTVIIGDGTNATATATLSSGKVVSVTLTDNGTGYTSIPSVTFSGGTPSVPATATAKIGKSSNGFQRLEDAKIYVLTDDFNVYLCIKNNGGIASTIKPTGIGADLIPTSDGYVWKFMYTLPLSIRNKFLTDAYMPVLSALRNQFYSNGAINTVSIQKPGTGYTSGSIAVVGDGFKTGEYFYVESVAVTTAGTGYSSATVTFDDPVTTSTAWVSGALAIQGTYLKTSGLIYQVELTGILGGVAPTHRSGSATNGAVSLKYIGKTLTGTATVSGGSVTGFALDAGIRVFSITNGGSGYTVAPSVTLTGGAGSGAVQTAVLQTGSVIDISIQSAGGSYTSTPTVVIGTAWAATTAYTFGQQIFTSNRLYTVTVAGTSSGSAPSHTSGAVANGTATLTYAGVAATATCTLRYGEGYKVTPKAYITGPGTGAIATVTASKTEAKMIPIFSAGQLSGVQVIDAGEGYTSATLTVSGTGTEAEVRAELSIGDINSLQSSNEILISDGSINAVEVASGGYGYSTATATVDGDGSGATVSVTILSGRVSKINVISPGMGYRWAKITIVGAGVGAVARPIISPFGGQGKYSVDNLFARTLMFFGNPSRDKVNGFTIDNDYRQFGILKAPTTYGTTYFARDQVMTPCWVVSATVNTAQFPADTLLTNSVGRKFRIISSVTTGALIQSIDNAPIIVGQILTNPALNTFTVTAVNAPNLNKYSGDLLFIDNRSAFTPTVDENVTLRTVVRF